MQFLEQTVELLMSPIAADDQNAWIGCYVEAVIAIDFLVAPSLNLRVAGKFEID